jgi:hypothetical protein
VLIECECANAIASVASMRTEKSCGYGGDKSDMVLSIVIREGRQRGTIPTTLKTMLVLPILYHSPKTTIGSHWGICNGNSRAN